jgi:Skp family chaperone for outer membrane proteins
MKRLWAPALGVVALGLALFSSRPATTAPAKNPGDTAIAVGYLDVQKVLQDSPAAINARKNAEALKTRLQERLAQLSNLLFLTEAEQTELKTLQDKSQPSDKEKERIAELVKRSEKAEEEYRSLQQKPNASDTEKARLAELSGLRNRNMGRLQAEQQKAQEELDEKAGGLMEGLQQQILKVVEAVAVDEKLTMVVDKQARLYGGRDITDLVVAKLKK